jgi:hypothetical protein
MTKILLGLPMIYVIHVCPQAEEQVRLRPHFAKCGYKRPVHSSPILPGFGHRRISGRATYVSHVYVGLPTRGRKGQGPVCELRRCWSTLNLSWETANRESTLIQFVSTLIHNPARPLEVGADILPHLVMPVGPFVAALRAPVVEVMSNPPAREHGGHLVGGAGHFPRTTASREVDVATR